MCLGGGDYYLSRMQILEAQILAIIMIACSMEIVSLCAQVLVDWTRQGNNRLRVLATTKENR